MLSRPLVVGAAEAGDVPELPLSAFDFRFGIAESPLLFYWCLARFKKPPPVNTRRKKRHRDTPWGQTVPLLPNHKG